MPKLNTFDVQALIDNLPAGLDRAILRTLSFHQGRECAISRSDLVSELWAIGFKVGERAARAQISQLRIDHRSADCAGAAADGGEGSAVRAGAE